MQQPFLPNWSLSYGRRRRTRARTFPVKNKTLNSSYGGTRHVRGRHILSRNFFSGQKSVENTRRHFLAEWNEEMDLK